MEYASREAAPLRFDLVQAAARHMEAWGSDQIRGLAFEDRVYLIDTDHEWAVRHTHADHLHTTGIAPRRCVLWDPRTPWTD